MTADHPTASRQLAASPPSNVTRGSFEEETPVRYLQVEPTTRCNYTCGFCCGRHMDQSDLGMERFARVLDALPDARHLELQGEGEPLLHRDFFRMLELAAKRDMQVSSITNGSLFTRHNIQRLVDSRLTSILISIESPDPASFRQIRGGSLEKVVKGIRALMQARGAEPRKGPVVGFAVTLLRETARSLPAIAELYRQLEMDGGILLHFLSAMDVHTQHYGSELSTQVSTKLQQALAWSQYLKIKQSEDYRDSGTRHFWDELLSPEQNGPPNSQRASSFRSCPWLSQGLYVDRHGVALPCPNVKDGQRHGFGAVEAEAREQILAARASRGNAVRAGVIPDGCGGCFIAEFIAERTEKLLEKVPRRCDDPAPMQARATPPNPDHALTPMIRALGDGTRTGAEIVRAVAEHEKLTREASRIAVLPVIDELIQQQRLTI